MSGFTYWPIGYGVQGQIPGSADLSHGTGFRVNKNLFHFDDQNFNPIQLHMFARLVSNIAREAGLQGKVLLTHVTSPTLQDGVFGTAICTDDEYLEGMYVSDEGHEEMIWYVQEDPNLPNFLNLDEVAGLLSEEGFQCNGDQLRQYAGLHGMKLPFSLLSNFLYHHNKGSNPSKGLRNSFDCKVYSPTPGIWQSYKTVTQNVQLANGGDAVAIVPYMKATRHLCTDWPLYQPNISTLASASTLSRIHIESDDTATFRERLAYIIQQAVLGIIEVPWLTKLNNGIIDTISIDWNSGTDCLYDLLFDTTGTPSIVETGFQNSISAHMWFSIGSTPIPAVPGLVLPSTRPSAHHALSSVTSGDDKRDGIVVLQEYQSRTDLIAQDWSNMLPVTLYVLSTSVLNSIAAASGPVISAPSGAESISLMKDGLPTSLQAFTTDGFHCVLPTFGDRTVTGTYVSDRNATGCVTLDGTATAHFWCNGRSVYHGFAMHGPIGGNLDPIDNAAKMMSAVVLHVRDIDAVGVYNVATITPAVSSTPPEFPSQVISNNQDLSETYQGITWFYDVSQILEDEKCEFVGGPTSWLSTKSSVDPVFTTRCVGGSIEFLVNGTFMGFVPTSPVIDELVSWASPADPNFISYESGFFAGPVFSSSTNPIKGVRIHVQG